MPRFLAQVVGRVTAAVQRVRGIVFPRAGGWWTPAAGTSRYDYRGVVGDGSGTSLVMAPVRWAMRNYPEAPLQVVRHEPDNTDTVLVGHPAAQLLARPNPAYGGKLLGMALMADAMLSGNAYLLKVRSGLGRPVELWWAPSPLIRPVAPDTDDPAAPWISYYEYSPRGRPLRVAVEDVIHLRPFGLDPQNQRLGWAPLAPLFAEIGVDLEAGAFTAAVLRNLGVPGVVLSPSGDEAMPQEAADQAKALWEQRFGGDNRGRVFVSTRGLKADIVSWSPQQLNLDLLRRLPESRICGVYGIKAVVLDFQVGLDHGTFHNYGEAREATYEEFLIPVQSIMAADLDTQLLTDFDSTGRSALQHDYTRVRVLQDDRDKLFAREALALARGGQTVDEFRAAIGKPSLPNGQGNVFYLPANVQVIPEGELAGAPPAAPATADGQAPRQLPAPRRNGTQNGAAAHAEVGDVVLAAAVAGDGAD